jgi:hypothetical protein
MAILTAITAVLNALAALFFAFASCERGSMRLIEALGFLKKFQKFTIREL